MKFKYTLPYCVLILFISIFLMGLIWLDHETTSWAQVLSPQYILTWLIYGLPLLVTLIFIYLILKKKMHDQWISMIMTIMFGTPTITVLLVFIYRFTLQ